MKQFRRFILRAAAFILASAAPAHAVLIDGFTSVIPGINDQIPVSAAPYDESLDGYVSINPPSPFGSDTQVFGAGSQGGSGWLTLDENNSEPGRLLLISGPGFNPFWIFVDANSSGDDVTDGGLSNGFGVYFSSAVSGSVVIGVTDLAGHTDSETFPISAESNWQFTAPFSAFSSSVNFTKLTSASLEIEADEHQRILRSAKL